MKTLTKALTEEARIKVFGAVFTPRSLVRRKVVALIKWMKRHHKDLSQCTFLEPAVGSGNYAIALVEVLMEELKNNIPDLEKRRKHILEKMIWMIDIQPMNIFMTQQYLDPESKYVLNLICADSLTYGFGDRKFDAVIGNPPYQKSDRNKDKLWPKFVHRARHEWLVGGGYLCFVHPVSWRARGSKMYQEFQERNVLELHLETNVFDGVGIHIDWYVMQNIQTQNKTEVYWNSSIPEAPETRIVLNLEEIPLLPKDYVITNLNILAKLQTEKNGGEGIKFERDGTLNPNSDRRGYISSKQNEKYEFECRHSAKYGTVWSSKTVACRTEKKVLCNYGGYMKAIYDPGKLGVTNKQLFILVKSEEEGRYLAELLNTSLFEWYTEFGTHGFNEPKLLKHFPKVEGLPLKNMSEALYTHFHLTPAEIKVVELTVARKSDEELVDAESE